jgi:hypothetical protein
VSAGRPYRIVLRDRAEPSYLRWLWAAGSTLLSGADARIAARNWVDARKQLSARIAEIPVGTTHVEAQVWGHGAEGESRIGGERLTAEDVPSLAALFPLAARPTLRFPRGLHVTVWLRQCDTLGGKAGHAFASAFSSAGLDVVGHCAVISLPRPWQQREVCGLRAGASPWWSLTGAELPSCSALQMAIKPEWFAPRPK